MTNPQNESNNPAIEHQLTRTEEIASSTPADGFSSAATFVDASDNHHRNAEEPDAKATVTLHTESNIDNPTSQPLVTTGDDPYYTEGWRNPGWLAGGSLFLVTTGTFGMMMSWGTFQPVYLEKVYPGQTDAFHIAFVGTIGHALSSSLGIPLSLVINKIGHRNTLAIGAVLCRLGLFLASIATQLWQTFITHGFIFGLGASFCFSASFMLPSQWFVRQRALVNGLANTGAAVGGLCFSPLSEYLMQTLGYRNALRVLGAILFGLFALATVLVRVRYPPSSSSSDKQQRDNNNYGSISTRASSSPLLSIPFALSMAFSLLAPFGYIVPFHFMPTYAMVELGCSPSVASTMVSVGMAANIVCRIALGFIGDRLGQINTLFIATFVSAIFTTTMWQNAHTLATYAAYVFLIGLTSGAYFGLIPSVLARIVGMKQYLYISGSMAWMFMAIGTLLGTPFFGRLAEISWTCAIQFAGATSLAAAACMFAIRFLLDKRLLSKL